jgi:hypothetical protein
LSPYAQPSAMNSTCASGSTVSTLCMNDGIVFIASCTGISPIDPLTSSANTIPTESGWFALSRLSRQRTPFGSRSG